MYNCTWSENPVLEENNQHVNDLQYLQLAITGNLRTDNFNYSPKNGLVGKGKKKKRDEKIGTDTADLNTHIYIHRYIYF